MRAPRILGLVALVVGVLAALGAPARAGKFGGFSADSTRWLDGRNTVCSAAAVDGDAQVVAQPVCETATDARALAAHKFVGPPRLKLAKSAGNGAVDLSIGADGHTVTVYGDAGG